jgi:hypothetical protein
MAYVKGALSPPAFKAFKKQKLHSPESEVSVYHGSLMSEARHGRKTNKGLLLFTPGRLVVVTGLAEGRKPMWPMFPLPIVESH